MKNVFIINEGLAGIILGALLIKKGIDVKIVSKKMPKIFPFFQNDIQCGVMSKVSKLLEIDTEFEESKNKLNIKTDKYSILLGSNINEFKNNLLSNFKNEEEKINTFITTIENLGEEWQSVIDNEFEFDWKNSKATIRYSNTSYKDFVEKIFKENSEIINVLLAIAPVYDISLNTMAGYLYTQVFDGCDLKMGISGFIDKCIEIIQTNNINFIDDLQDLNINYIEDKYEVSFDKNSFLVDLIVDTRDIKVNNKKYFNEVISYLSLEFSYDGEINENGDAEILFMNSNVKDSWESLLNNNYDNPAFILWNDTKKNGRSKNKYRIDILVNSEGYKGNETNIIKNVLKNLKIEIPLKDIVIFTPNDYENMYGVRNGTGIRWAFTKEQSMKDPFKLEKKPSYYFISDWGFAWFSVALATYYQISKKYYKGKEYEV